MQVAAVSRMMLWRSTWCYFSSGALTVVSLHIFLEDALISHIFIQNHSDLLYVCLYKLHVIKCDYVALKISKF